MDKRDRIIAALAGLRFVFGGAFSAFTIYEGSKTALCFILYILTAPVSIRLKNRLFQAAFICSDVFIISLFCVISGFLPVIVFSLLPLFATPLVCEGYESFAVLGISWAIDLLFFNLWYMVAVSHLSIFYAGYLLKKKLQLERKHREREMLEKEFKEKLEIAKRLSMEFAHEIKNPLMNISAVIELAKTMEVSEEVRRLLEKAETEVKRASKLTRDFARIDFSGFNKSAFNICRALEESAKFFKHIRVDIHCKDVNVYGDEEAFKKAFFNILQNSSEAGADQVIVTVSVKNHRVVITFEDNGKGIDENIREKIFMPFFTTKREGTGLGLAIVKNIAEAHGGSVRVSGRNIIIMEIEKDGRENPNS